MDWQQSAKLRAVASRRLEDISVNQLAERFEEGFDEECRSRHKRYLIRGIAWRLRANAEGELTERARQRAAELASDAEVRITPPRESVTSMGRLLLNVLLSFAQFEWEITGERSEFVNRYVSRQRPRTLSM